MTEDLILENLEKLLTDLDVELRYEKGSFRGGFYRYKDKCAVVINKDLNVNHKITLVATELKMNFDLDSLYVVPALREVISNAGRLGQQ
ncbi:MAG: hypothetical protein ACE5G1_00780 [bacterium]